MNIKKGKQLMPDGHFKADALSHFHIGLMLQNQGRKKVEKSGGASSILVGII
jgi:hypothetical protein